MNTKLSEPKTSRRIAAKDELGELKNREIVSQINKMRKVDNWTN